MSQIVALFEAPGMTSKQYNDIMDELRSNGQFPDKNCLSHVAYHVGESLHVVDVWSSPEALMEYGQHALFPIFARLQITPPVPQVFPANNFVIA